MDDFGRDVLLFLHQHFGDCRFVIHHVFEAQTDCEKCGFAVVTTVRRCVFVAVDGGAVLVLGGG